MTDFIVTSVKYYLLSKSKGKVVLDVAKTGSNSKSQEPKAQAKVAVAVEENGNDDPFARNQKELQEAVFWSQGRSEWPFISSPVGMATMPSLQMLSREWENTEEIRDRVRKDGVLLWKEAWEDKLKIDIHHTAKNYSVLRPLCQRLQDSNGAVGMHTVPKIQHQIKMLYMTMNIPCPPKRDLKQAAKDVKKCLVLIKQKLQRGQICRSFPFRKLMALVYDPEEREELQNNDDDGSDDDGEEIPSDPDSEDENADSLPLENDQPQASQPFAEEEQPGTPPKAPTQPAAAEVIEINETPCKEEPEHVSQQEFSGSEDEKERGEEEAAGMLEAGEGELDNSYHEESLALNENHVETMGDDPGSKGDLDSDLDSRPKKKEERIEELQKKLAVLRKQVTSAKAKESLSSSSTAVPVLESLPFGGDDVDTQDHPLLDDLAKTYDFPEEKYHIFGDSEPHENTVPIVLRRQQLGLRKKGEDEEKAPTKAKGRGKGRGKGKKVEKKQTAVDQEDTEKDEGKVNGQDENEGEGKDDSKTKAGQDNDPNEKGDGVNTDTKEVKKKEQGSWCPKLPKQKRTPTQKEPTGASQGAPGKETPGRIVSQSGSQAEKMPTGKNSGESGKKKDKDLKPKTPKKKKNEKEPESHEMKGTRGKKRETEESKSAEDLEVVEKGAADPKGAGACEKPAPTKRVRTKQPQNTETPASKRVENSGDGMGDAKPKKAPASKKTKKTKQKKPRCTALSRPDLWKTHGYESDPIEDSEEEERSEKEEVEGSAKEDAKVEVPRRKAAQAKAKTSKPQQANPGDDKQEKKKKNPRKEGSPEEEEAPPKRRRRRSSSPASFARRNCPKSEFGKAKWHALKRAFTELIRPRLTTYSAHEDKFWQFATSEWKKDDIEVLSIKGMARPPRAAGLPEQFLHNIPFCKMIKPANRFKLDLVMGRLYAMGAPQLLLASIALLALNPEVEIFTEAYGFLEFFCGQAWVSTVMRASGVPTAQFDISLGNPKQGKQDAMDLLTPSGFSLALVSLLNAKMGEFEALFGLVCSSYVTVSAGTHKRTPWNPLGDVNIDMVWCGNKLAAVTVLLIMVVSAMNGAWILEQPSSTRLLSHPRVRHLWHLLPRVYEARWWMAMFGSLTPKRHVAWSNSRSVKLLDLGVLAKVIRDKLAKHAQQSTRKYTNGRGKRAFVGTKFLKNTQTYPPRFALRLAKYYGRFISNREALPPELLCEDAPSTSTERILNICDWDDDTWSDAGLDDLFCYLRGSKSLQLGEWRPLFPTHI
ncbi:unnamed protein product [Cladocopium goreaui]|uniref:Uncharacterized protein n=1 Tax=Cladocopium goreaui TaxID=2562237 RepID=A0A9P1BRH6_9DINO|nr:unnamed protein product [Cladocopium goreaui]